MTTFTVTVDWENNAELFWDSVRAHKGLEARIDSGVVSEEDRKLIESLPGFSDGPDHAPTAVIFGLEKH